MKSFADDYVIDYDINSRLATVLKHA